MTPERVQQLREIAHVLMSLFRTVAMYRALRTDRPDNLNFFRVYRGCLMEMSVVAWCKALGARGDEAHWTRVFPEDEHEEIRGELSAQVGGRDAFQALWDKTTCYRNRFVAHHTFDEGNRPERHPYLIPLFKTGSVIYRRVYEELETADHAGGLAHPSSCEDAKLDRLVAHWADIAAAARAATQGFENIPSG